MGRVQRIPERSILSLTRFLQAPSTEPLAMVLPVAESSSSRCATIQRSMWPWRSRRFFPIGLVPRCSRLRWKKVRDPENYTSKQVGSQPEREIPKGGLMRSGALCRRRFDVSSRLRRQQESGPPLAGGLFLTHYCATACPRL